MSDKYEPSKAKNARYRTWRREGIESLDKKIKELEALHRVWAARKVRSIR